MIRYIIISPTHNVDLKAGTTTISVLCGDIASHEFYWGATNKKEKAIMFPTRTKAEIFIAVNKLLGAFSYGIVK